MIDAVDLLLAIVALQLGVEFAGAGKVGAEGLLDDDPMMSDDAVEAGLVQVADDAHEIVRRHG